MSFTSNYDRSIVTHARKLLLERTCHSRRIWELMVADRERSEIMEEGRNKISEFQLMMIDISGVDLLDANLTDIRDLPLSLTDTQMAMLETFSRYLLVELTGVQLQELLEELSRAIVQWSWSCGSIVPPAGQEDLVVDLVPIMADTEDALYNSINYVTLILLADLHHTTYIQSAEKCLEMLSST